MEDKEFQQIIPQENAPETADDVARKAQKLNVLEAVLDVAGEIIEQIIDAVT